jgi:hypothetical protein
VRADDNRAAGSRIRVASFGSDLFGQPWQALRHEVAVLAEAGTKPAHAVCIPR